MKYTILGTEVDKKGSTLVIKHSDSLSFSPAYTFFIRQMADLIDNHNGMAYTTWDDSNCGIIWAEIENTVVGIICYDKSWITDPIPYLAIQLTAVSGKYRQRGIHKTMNNYFEEIARNLNCVAIRATVNLKNSVRLATAEKDQLVPMLVIMTKRIDNDH